MTWAAVRHAHEDAERVFPRARVHDVPDDWTAFQVKDLQHPPPAVGERLSPLGLDVPESQAVLALQAAHLSDAERELVLHDNVAELYALPRG
jgi:hypothetical protein